jgi:hypothetical protein
MGVDWDRLSQGWLERAITILQAIDVDALFIFHTEDVPYLTGHRSHLGPAKVL